MHKFKFGWHGDQGLGEEVIQLIITGKKTVSVGPAYDTEDAGLQEGDEVLLVDKNLLSRGVLRVSRIEIRPFGQLDESIAQKCGGLSLDQLCQKLYFANSRKIGRDEEMRIINFHLVSAKPPVER